MKALLGEGTNQTSRRAMLLGGLTALSLFAANAAAPRAAEAARPSTQKVVQTQTLLNECPQGFTSQQQDNIQQTVRIFESGRQQSQIRVDSIYTNLTSGKDLRANNSFMITFGEDQVAFSGLVLHVVVPGEGSVIDAGRFVFDRQTGSTILDRGPTENLNICNALD